MEMEVDLTARDNKEDEMDTSKLRIVTAKDFKYAMTMDRIDILQEIIQLTGHGIPVQRLIKSSGIEIVEKPKVR